MLYFSSLLSYRLRSPAPYKNEGSFFGYPYKHAKDVIDPEFGDMIDDLDLEFVDPIACGFPTAVP